MVAVSLKRTDPQRKCSYGHCEFKEKKVGKLVTQRRATKLLRASIDAAGGPCVKQLLDAGDLRES